MENKDTDVSNTSLSNNPKNIDDLCCTLSKLFNYSDLDEIKSCQQSVINQLEKCNKKTASCVDISKNYREKLTKQFLDYNKKLDQVKKQMDDIQTRLIKLESNQN